MRGRFEVGGQCRVMAGCGGNPVPEGVIGTGKGRRLLVQQAAADRLHVVLDHVRRQRIGEQDPVP